MNDAIHWGRSLTDEAGRNRASAAIGNEAVRADLDQALSLIPGKHRLNRHAFHGELGGKKMDRDAIEPKHFKKWIGNATKAAGTTVIWSGLPKLCVVLAGFTTNFICCVLLNIKNRNGYQYLASHVREEHAHPGGTGGSERGGATKVGGVVADLKIPAFTNYLFSALAGTCWYFQFFFYTMGETQIGKFSFASWTLHMASIINFSTIWGWIFHEWKGSSKKAHLSIGGGIATLILSTIVIGFGTFLKSKQ